MFRLFIEGDVWFMSILTILLVAIFFAAWKAPSWVKEIGSIARAVGFIGLFLGLRQMFDVFQKVAASRETVTSVFDLVSPGVFFGGWKVAMIPVIYGIIIYIVSRIVCIIQKPKL